MGKRDEGQMVREGFFSMNDRRRVLILGGTGEAAALAAKVAQMTGVEVISSLAGRTQKPIAPIGLVRRGGFGGEAGLADFLRESHIDCLVDATHPFAAQMSWNAIAAASEVGIPHVMLVRPAWQKTAADRWIEVDHIEAAVTVLEKQAHEKQAQRVFLTIGRQQLAPFARLQTIWFLMRSIDPPDPALPRPEGLMLLDRPPFTVEQERQLLVDHVIDTIVSKNSGGDATYAKIIVARERGMPIVMVNRPEMPSCKQVSDVDSAITWLKNSK
jgi:precorrin-6A/cobalt-precorrin-6A reductase